jgi:hypothetical protein
MGKMGKCLWLHMTTYDYHDTFQHSFVVNVSQGGSMFWSQVWSRQLLTASTWVWTQLRLQENSDDFSTEITWNHYTFPTSVLICFDRHGNLEVLSGSQGRKAVSWLTQCFSCHATSNIEYCIVLHYCILVCPVIRFFCFTMLLFFLPENGFRCIHGVSMSELAFYIILQRILVPSLVHASGVASLSIAIFNLSRTLGSPQVRLEPWSETLLFDGETVRKIG